MWTMLSHLKSTYVYLNGVLVTTYENSRHETPSYQTKFQDLLIENAGDKN